jgi:hypothetical protein
MPAIEAPAYDLQPLCANQKRFPLNTYDCKILTAILDKFNVYDSYGYPRKPLVRKLAESIGMDEDNAYYCLKFLRMARFS